jgi:hypothetical protein
LFEISKIKEITRKGKIPKNGGNPRANPLSQSMYPIIDNIFASYNLMEHHVPSFVPNLKRYDNIQGLS